MLLKDTLCLFLVIYLFYNKFLNNIDNLILSTDGEKWVPAENSEYKSIPVETRVETHNNNFFDDVEVYSIHEFKPYLLLEEEGYFVINFIFFCGFLMKN